MADQGMVALREALGKILASEHADVLREGVALVLREVMELEAGQATGAERYERSAERLTYRNGYRPREFDRRWGRSSWPSPSCDRAPICRASSTRGSGPSRRCSASSWRRTRMACRPGRWSGWSSSSVSSRCPRAKSAASVRRWTSASRSFATGRWKAPTRICGWTPASSVSATRVGHGQAKGALGRLRRA